MAERWKKDVILNVTGVPWRPVPGRGGEEIRVDVNIPEPREVIPPIPRQPDVEPARRRVRINRSDIVKHGYTVGCDGCHAVRYGLEHRGHNEKCRTRIEEKLAEENSERLNRANERMNHELAERVRRNVEGAEGEEQRVKRARAEERKENEEERQEAVNKRKAEEEPSEEPPHKYQQVNDEEEKAEGRQDDEMKNDAEGEGALMSIIGHGHRRS